MNSLITTLPPVRPSATLRTVLAQDGFHGTLVALQPDEQFSSADVAESGEHVLYVAEGSATVRRGEINTVLNQDEALLVGQGGEYTIIANHTTPARVLKLDVPPRQLIAPAIVTFEA